jgi:hypothetical protein
MSKCREAFEAMQLGPVGCHNWSVWQAAWNAAIASAAEICYHEAGVYTKEDAAQAIKREKE